MKTQALQLPLLNGRLLDIIAPSLNLFVEKGPAALTVAGSCTIEEDAASVRVNVKAQGFWFARGDLQLRLPSDARVRAVVSAGSLHVEGLRNVELDFETQSGGIHIEDVTGRLRLRTTAGNVHVEGFAGAFDLETLAGGIHLEVDDLVAGHHNARTFAGSLHVELAEQIQAKIEARATLGAVRSSVRSFEDAVVRLSLVSDVGAVRVVKGSAHHHHHHYCAPLSMNDILERVARGVLPVDQAEALIDRLERAKKEKP